MFDDIVETGTQNFTIVLSWFLLLSTHTIADQAMNFPKCRVIENSKELFCVAILRINSREL